MNESQIERHFEHAVDHLDKNLMAGRIDQADYDIRYTALSAWCESMTADPVANAASNLENPGMPLELTLAMQREACAAMCEQRANSLGSNGAVARQCAKDIRAMGENLTMTDLMSAHAQSITRIAQLERENSILQESVKAYRHNLYAGQIPPKS